MEIKLSDNFTYKKLLRFTLPSIAMMIFTSIYGVVDGFFVSNFAGKTPFAAVNFIIPFLIILSTTGFMFGAGGSALIAKNMGEGDYQKANRIFSFLIYTSIVISIIIAILGFIFIEPIAAFLGAEGQLLSDSVLYGRIILIALPAYVLQMEFQSFFITAEKPKLGLAVTVASGVTNMILDVLLVGVFPLGLVGAATATALSQTVGGLFPLIYFARKNNSPLRLTGAKFDGKALAKTCSNGLSEFMNCIALSFLGILYNAQLLIYAGEDGVAAFGVIMYVSMVFSAIFMGYSVGCAPIISFHFGAQNKSELRSLLIKSLTVIGISSISMTLLSFILASPFSKLFVGYDEALLNLTIKGFFVYSLSFLFMGVATFSSSFFTALNDGVTSALIAFLRTLVFQTSAVILLPLIFDTDGIWWSLVVAESMAFTISFIFIFAKRKKFGYIKLSEL